MDTIFIQIDAAYQVTKNILNARAKYTKAASMLRYLLTVFDFLRISSNKLARYAIDVKTQSALRINNTPSENICRVTLSLPVFTNCGKKTKKNSATFGLVRFIITPVR
jgi:hypothetical protein